MKPIAVVAMIVAFLALVGGTAAVLASRTGNSDQVGDVAGAPPATETPDGWNDDQIASGAVSVGCPFGTPVPDDDIDGDGLDYTAETAAGTNPCYVDTDFDGLTDFQEVNGVQSPDPGLGILFPDPLDPNTDDDACTDGQELDPDPTKGGLRDPTNPWDFYDVAGAPPPQGDGQPDGIIDLPNDILGVIQHYSPQGQAPYDVLYDRGPSAGPNPWNMTAPDGVIDLPNDILGVILQFNHRCV